MSDDQLSRLFAFESDLDTRLACVPMAVRFKLDAAGIKLHLKEWVNLDEADRRALLGWSAADGAGFSAHVVTAVEARAGRAPDRFAPPAAPDWAQTAAPPEAVATRVRSLGLELTPARWAALTPLQRFVLVKLSGPKHDSANLLPALKEFGLA